MKLKLQQRDLLAAINKIINDPALLAGFLKAQGVPEKADVGASIEKIKPVICRILTTEAKKQETFDKVQYDAFLVTVTQAISDFAKNDLARATAHHCKLLLMHYWNFKRKQLPPAYEPPDAVPPLGAAPCASEAFPMSEPPPPFSFDDAEPVQQELEAKGLVEAVPAPLTPAFNANLASSSGASALDKQPPPPPPVASPQPPKKAPPPPPPLPA